MATTKPKKSNFNPTGSGTSSSNKVSFLHVSKLMEDYVPSTVPAFNDVPTLITSIITALKDVLLTKGVCEEFATIVATIVAYNKCPLVAEMVIEKFTRDVSFMYYRQLAGVTHTLYFSSEDKLKIPLGIVHKPYEQSECGTIYAEVIQTNIPKCLVLLPCIKVRSVRNVTCYLEELGLKNSVLPISDQCECQLNITPSGSAKAVITTLHYSSKYFWKLTLNQCRDKPFILVNMFVRKLNELDEGTRTYTPTCTVHDEVPVKTNLAQTAFRLLQRLKDKTEGRDIVQTSKTLTCTLPVDLTGRTYEIKAAAFINRFATSKVDIPVDSSDDIMKAILEGRRTSKEDFLKAMALLPCGNIIYRKAIYYGFQFFPETVRRDIMDRIRNEMCFFKDILFASTCKTYKMKKKPDTAETKLEKPLQQTIKPRIGKNKKKTFSPSTKQSVSPSPVIQGSTATKRKTLGENFFLDECEDDICSKKSKKHTKKTTRKPVVYSDTDESEESEKQLTQPFVSAFAGLSDNFSEEDSDYE